MKKAFCFLAIQLALVASAFCANMDEGVRIQDSGAPSSYSFLSEYDAGGSFASGMEKNASRKGSRLHLGVVSGAFALFDGYRWSSESKYLSFEDSHKAHIGLVLTGKFSGINLSLSPQVTYNGHYLPISVSAGYRFHLGSMGIAPRARYYMHDINDLERLDSSGSREEHALTIGLASFNAIPLRSSYSFTTAVLVDFGYEVSWPSISYLTWRVGLSIGWGHVFSNLIDRNDFFAGSVAMEISVNLI